MMEMMKFQFLFLAVFVFFVQFTCSAPVMDVHDSNDIVDEIFNKLKQLKQQSEGTQHHFRSPSFYGNPHPDEVFRVQRTLENLGGGYLLKRAQSGMMDSLGGGLLKRTPNDSPRGTLDSLGGGYLLL